LRKARSYLVMALSVIDQSANDDVRNLKASCNTALTWLNKKLGISP
jgi:hypothetical protein